MKNVTLKLAQVLQLNDSFRQLADIKFPVKGSYAIARIAAKLESEAKHLMEQRTKMITEMGVINPENGSFSIEPGTPAFDEFNKQWGELMDDDIVIETMVIRLEQLGDMDIEPRLFSALLPFMEELDRAPVKQDTIPAGFPALDPTVG